MSYIPDITERFPEGFGGVDMTSSFFPSERDWRDDYFNDGFEIPFEDGETEIPVKPRKFAEGQKIESTNWFNGSNEEYIVRDRTDDAVMFTVKRYEMDGNSETIEEYEIYIDNDLNEYVVLHEYRGEKNMLYA